jgi:dTDP-4-dehydrorhamnose reductase
MIRNLKPKVIINAAAYTNVDGCEDDKENCWKANVTAVEYIAQAARSVDAALVHVSSDYVFDGVEGNYSEASKPHPLSYYGRSKLAGENAVIASGVEHAIVRTMILYGTGKDIRPNFALWLIDMVSKSEIVRITDDQFGHPTLADDLARAIHKLVELRKSGLFHIAGADYVSRYEFAIKLATVFELDANLIRPVKTSELKQKAVRPMHSKFDLTKLKQELNVELNGIEQGLKILKRQLADAKDKTAHEKNPRHYPDL